MFRPLTLLVSVVALAATPAMAGRPEGATSRSQPQPRPSGLTPTQQGAKGRAEFDAYVNWIRRVERDRSTLRDAGIRSTTPAQALAATAGFIRNALKGEPPVTSDFGSVHHRYADAVEREANYAADMVRFYADNRPGSAVARAENTVKVIEKDLDLMRQAITRAYTKRGLSSPPTIATCRDGSYFGYLATRAGK